MRFDQVQLFNTNLKQQARLCEQMVAYHEQEIAKIKATGRMLLSLASTEPGADDVAIDVKPFELPSIFKPKPGQTVRDYGRFPTPPDPQAKFLPDPQPPINALDLEDLERQLRDAPPPAPQVRN